MLFTVPSNDIIVGIDAKTRGVGMNKEDHYELAFSTADASPAHLNFVCNNHPVFVDTNLLADTQRNAGRQLVNRNLAPVTKDDAISGQVRNKQAVGFADDWCQSARCFFPVSAWGNCQRSAYNLAKRQHDRQRLMLIAGKTAR